MSIAVRSNRWWKTNQIPYKLDSEYSDESEQPSAI